MDPIAISIIAGVVVLAGVYFIFFSKDDEPTQSSNPVRPGPVKTPTTPNPQLAKAVVKAASKPKLPKKADLEKMTKSNLEELGREYGVELDKRKTKVSMIADLKSGVYK